MGKKSKRERGGAEQARVGLSPEDPGSHFLPDFFPWPLPLAPL